MERSFDWKGLLQKLHLLPPQGETAEATLAAWWLTRIGLVLLILAAVFFGVRIARDVPPWVRVLTLSGIAAAVTWFGTWLEKRVAAFGRLISAGGLGLFFFTAFAAYGLEATKVIENPVLGLLAQAVAVVLVAGWSLWKKDESVAAMAVVLGHVACVFSSAHDLHSMMLTGLVLIAATAAGFHVLRGWLWPLGLAIAGGWIGMLWQAGTEWSEHRPELAVVLGWITALVVVFEVALVLGERRFPSLSEAARKTSHRLAMANSSLAVATAWLGVRWIYPSTVEAGEWSAAYLLLAIVTALFAAVRWRMEKGGHVAEVFFLKASALLALFVVQQFQGPTRWLSLATQTLILLWSYRRNGRRWIEIGTGLLWIAALGVMVHDWLHAGPLTSWSFASAAHAIGWLSVVILALVVALHEAWEKEPGSESAMMHRFTAGLLGTAACLLSGPAAFVGSRSAIVALVLLGAGLALPGLLLKRWSVLCATVPPAVLAFLAFLGSSPVGDYGDAQWFGLGGALVGVYAMIAEALRRHGRGNAEALTWLRAAAWTMAGSVMTRVLLEWRSLGPVRAELDTVAVVLLAATTCAVLLRMRWPQAHADSASREDSNASQALITLALVASVWWICVVVALSSAHPVWGGGFAVVALALGAVAAWRRCPPLALPAAVTLFGGLFLHLSHFRSDSSLTQQAWSAGLIAACVMAASIFGRKIEPPPQQREPVAWAHALLHGIAVLVVHRWLADAVSLRAVLLADTALAWIMLAASRPLRMPILRLTSMLPLVGLMIEALSQWEQAIGAEHSLLAWLAVAGCLGWWRFAAGTSTDSDSPLAEFWERCIEIVAVLAATTASLFAAEDRWLPLGPIVVAVAASGLPLFWKKDALVPGLSWLPWTLGALSTLLSASHLTSQDTAMPQWLRLAVLALLLLAHGPLWARSIAALGKRRPVGPTWIHGLLVLLVLFPAYSTLFDRLTTVSWGAAAIGLFLIGLFVSLKPYRLAGLLGLAIAIFRMFTVDIDDGLHRIYAFFAISLLLLLIGWLYHRFKDRIDTLTPKSD
ncbi:MAG: DUF2339 domain-containing protein [Verrucomicrobiales bacterium]|nr:DUF2339 domain-containing protein [Verrucomicrobiales bacterium]